MQKKSILHRSIEIASKLGKIIDMMYYYCPKENITDTTAAFPEQESRHIRTVKRLGPGDPIRFSDGRGGLYTGSITQTGDKRNLVVDLLEKKEVERRPPLVIAGFSVPKQKRIDIVLEKGTELGIDRFVPVHFKRSEVRLKDQGNKTERIRRQVLNASKQSQRLFFPEVMPATDLQEFIALSEKEEALLIFGHTGEGAVPVRHALREAAKRGLSTAITLTGPEGGITDSEAEQLQSSGFQPVSLGPNILRTETAVLCFATAAGLILDREQD